MKDSIIIGLLQNTAILLAFTMLYENIWVKNEDSKSIRAKIIIGLFLSGIGVVLMYTPWTWIPGIAFDTRSVMISISGLFFGPIPTIIVMAITSIVRLLIGGDGQWMGIAVIISSGTIGLLWRKYRPNWKTRKYYQELLAMGLIVHITMSACSIFLPADTILATLKVIAFPLIFIYSPATMILGIVMLKQYKNWQNRFAQLKLVESERRFTQILESGNIVSLLLDKDGSINYCNNYFLEITGYSIDEIIGKDWFNIFIPADSKEEIDQVFSDSINANNVIKNFENVILSKSGEQLYMSWHNATLQSESNEVTGIVSIGVNITKSRIYENQLTEKNTEIESQNKVYKQINKELKKAKERAEESDQLKSAFLSNMSHEIRTPMNGILGFAELLKEPNYTIEEQQNFIRIIEKSGVRMLNIINDIIDISKIEAGLMQVNLKESNVNEQIEYVHTFFKPEIEKKGIQFSFNNQLPSKDATIITDREKLFAILTNLVKNAIKFTIEGSIELGYKEKGKYLEFFIKDTGIAIPKNRQEAIFERFVQADIADKMAIQGAGLGLAISKSYVEMLGGKIWVESKVGIGSTFYFTIPYKTAPKEVSMISTSVTSEELGVNIKDLKILIVEDDMTSNLLLSTMIKKISREVLYLENGQEAIEACQNNPDIDLVLMDIKMPIMDGYEATRQIRLFNKDVIIIAQTANALSGDQEKAMESGCSAYIAKPIIKNELLLLLSQYFGNN